MMILLKLAAPVSPGQQAAPFLYLNPRRVISVSYGGGLQCNILLNDSTTLQLGCDTSESAMELTNNLGDDIASFVAGSYSGQNMDAADTWGEGLWPLYTVRTFSTKRPPSGNAP